MKKIEYKITFFDYWHLSSGESGGSSFDSLAIKDEFGLPYVPGKTLKGLTRGMAEVIDINLTNEIFGTQGNTQAKSYFSNANLKDEQLTCLRANKNFIKHLYSKVTQTKIDKNGISDDKSLREIEVVIPLELYGEIYCDEENLIKSSLKMIKQMGLNRNRGLGRCQIEVINDK